VAALVTRDDVRRRKPHPEPFLHAAGLLRLSPADCIAVEDSRHGMQAAHAAGMRCILVPDIAPVPAPVAARALAVLPDLHAVRCILTGN
jgi:beta-phosphoglucomutase-like phosphatase (HAD superfamily)